MSSQNHQRIVGSEWGLIAGPAILPEATKSFCIYEITEYRPEDVIQTILAYPQVAEIHPAVPDVGSWVAKWQQGDRHIQIKDTELLGDEQPFWGSVAIEADCRIDDFLRLWEHIRSTYSAIWAYDRVNDCLHNPDSIVEEFTRQSSSAPTTLQVFLEAYRSADGRMQRRILEANPELAKARLEDGKCILHFSFASPWLCEWLLEHGADPNSHDAKGLTPLQYAAKWVNARSIELLLQHGAEVNLIDEEGNSPLHWAVDRGRDDVAKLLLAAGADRRLKDREGRTPFQLAMEKGKTWLLDLLR